MSPKGPPKVAWQPNESTVPLQQGDLLLVAWAKTIEPQLDAARTSYPTIGRRDAFSLRFWDGDNPPILGMWGCLNYGLVIVIADDCAIDKEFNILRERYVTEGVEFAQASERANEHAEPYVAVAEVWPMEALPEHLQRDAESGAVGYIPFSMGEVVPEDPRAYAVDLNRMATISWRAIDRRLAMRDDRWRQRLQTQLCRFFAARTIRVNDELAEIFDQPVVRAEALTPPAGSPPRTRARLHFVDGKSVILEAVLGNTAEQEDGSVRPGLKTRQ
ncbi:MAG: hypothetical protein M3Z66_21385 [Chloroflexota bacterium]|nr:hypothetical protein [Chloroflexota bacterium]